MEGIDEQIEIAKQFFEAAGKNDHCYYRLYAVKHVDSTYTQSDLKAQNFETDSMEDSLSRLKRDMEYCGQYSRPFFVLKHFSTKSDPAPIERILKNPLFDPSHQKGNVNGNNNSINGLNGNNESMLITLLKSHHAETMQLRSELQDLRHERELELLEDRISGLENSSKTKVDVFSDFLNTPVGQQLAGIFGGVLATQFSAAKVAVVVPAVANVQNEEVPSNHVQDKQIVDQTDAVNRITNSLQTLDQIFDGDGITALDEIAKFCANNPGFAQSLRSKKPL